MIELSQSTPQRAWFTSPWLTFVGRPVEGPPRCTSTITHGISAMIANPSPSCISEKPGPLVPVNTFFPVTDAPMIAQIEAISSSICMNFPPFRGRRTDISSAISVEGVIGYPAKKSSPAYRAASTQASFPWTKVNLPPMSLLLRLYLDCQIRAPQFAQFAANAILRPGRHHLIVFIQFQNLLGTKMHTNPAPLAPVAIDHMRLELQLRHMPSCPVKIPNRGTSMRCFRSTPLC